MSHSNLRLQASRALVVIPVLSLLACGRSAAAEVRMTSDQLAALRVAIADRIEALTILGGDFGFAGSKISLSGQVLPGERADEQLSGTKFGGAGDIGDPQPLGLGSIGWQGRLQGNLGHLDWTDNLHSPPLAGDRSKYTANAIEFGGGARFWLTQSLSIAPTLMGVYGHVSNDYRATSGFARSDLNELRRMGLVDWHVDVWSVRPAVNIQYLITVQRATLALSSDLTYFHTGAFKRSNAQVAAGGDSGFVTSKADLDVPLNIAFGGHELHTGGFVSRTDLLGHLESGVGVQHLNEVHGRLVLDYLNQLWKVEWLGLGASYIWGTEAHGWAAGLDVKFKF